MVTRMKMCGSLRPSRNEGQRELTGLTPAWRRLLRPTVVILLAALSLASGCIGYESRTRHRAPDDDAKMHALIMLRVEKAGITDPLVLDAMRKVFWRNFEPERRTEGPAEWFAEPPDPVVFARMLELLGLKGDEKILQVSAGTGYEAAVLSRIGASVYSIAILPDTVETAAKRIENLGYSNVFFKCGDPVAGWEECAPFDAIVVSEPLGRVPQAFLTQLKEGGRIAVPVGAEFSEKTLQILVKENGVMAPRKRDRKTQNLTEGRNEGGSAE
jgi:protein-L-isoaspartate(D-aspartate) O-methyltransferase